MAIPQQANIISRWNLDEESGTRVDAVGSNDLTDNNTVLYSTDYKEEPNSADFEFDNSEHLLITDATQTGLDITGEITISCWAKIETLTANTAQRLVTKYNVQGNQRGYQLAIHTDHKVVVTLSSNGTDYIFAYSTDTLTTNTWYNLVFTLNQTTDLIQVYIDGSANGTAVSKTTDIYNNSADFIIGGQDNTPSSPDPVNPVDGLIDDVIIWDKALTSAEVTALYDTYPIVAAVEGEVVVRVPYLTSRTSAIFREIRVE